MATPTAITRFTPVFKPLTNITPFTFRDGYTFLEMYEALRAYLTETLSPELDAKLTLVYDEVQAQVNALAVDVNASKDAWQALFDEFMANIVVELEALNDTAAANLARDTQSQLRVALNDHFIQAVGAYTFYVNPATGADTNEGTLAAPFKTVKFALDLIMATTTKNNVKATVNLAAGAYPERYVFPDFTPFNFNVLIQGPDVGGHPFTPTAVFTEGDGASAIAFINRNPGANITWKDVKFSGYNGTASSGAVSSTNGTTTYENAHADRCYYGFSSSKGSMNLPNGKITNCGYLFAGGGSGAGVRSLMQNRHSIGKQSAGARAETLIIEDSYAGVFAQESSTGHVDWCVIRRCGRGLNINVNSRVNADGTLFEDCSIAVYANGNSHVFLTTNNSFVNNGTRLFATAGAEYLVGTGIDFADVTTAISRIESIIDGDYTVKTATTDVATLYRKKFIGEWFKDEFLLGGAPVKKIRTRSVVKLTGTTGAKTVTVRHLGYAVALTYGASEEGYYSIETEIIFLSPTKQLVTVTSTGNLLQPRQLITERTAVLGGEHDVMLEANTTNALDSVESLFTEMFLAK